MDSIFKIWGERKRVLLTSTSEIDLLYLKKDTFCSLHNHKYKINLFGLISGKVIIETEFGRKELKQGEKFEVYPNLKHRFIAITDAKMIEIAYVNEGSIDEKDISREKLGGKIIKGEYISIPELRERGLLEL